MIWIMLTRLLILAAIVWGFVAGLKAVLAWWDKRSKRLARQKAEEARELKHYYEDMGRDEMSAAELAHYEELCEQHGFDNKLIKEK